jgi:hypothetical protein
MSVFAAARVPFILQPVTRDVKKFILVTPVV